MTDSKDITNRALAQIGTRSQITSMTDGSAEALYANLLYNPLRDFLLREGDYAFSLKDDVATSVAGAVPPWTNAYTYPTDALRLRSLIPTVYDALDPLPIPFSIAVLGSVRLILTRESISRILYTKAPTSEDLWDSLFTESFTRLLGSALAFALENRIEASNVKLQEALSFAGIANLRDS